MKNSIVTGLILASVVFHVGVATAKSKSNETKSRVEENVQKQMQEKRRRITSEAVSALNETRNALLALDQGKKDEALSSLERATGKLELLLSREPSLAFAPTEVRALVTDVFGDLRSIKEVRRQADRLLDDGQVQATRSILRDFASEMTIGVTSIPLASYPAALKSASRLIDENKIEEAKQAVQAALNTLAIIETVVPLPVLAAEILMSDAEQLAQKKDRTAEENRQLSQHLEAARAELEFAEAFGYGTKRDFSNMYAQLNEIEGKAKNGKFGAEIFSKIKATLSSMTESSQVAKNKRNESRSKQ